MIPRRTCAFHADRAAHAACVSCRTVLCQECATAYDGIFYCGHCLAERRRALRSRAAPLSWMAMLLATALLFVLHVRLAVWTGALLAGLF
jgi:hypothetical protein